MPCLVALLAFFFPRLVIIAMVIFGDYIGRAYDTWIWPLLGFFIMPYTTLAYAWSINEHGGVTGWRLAVVILAVLIDLGVIGGGARTRGTATMTVRMGNGSSGATRIKKVKNLRG